LKCMSWREAMEMSLADIDICYRRAAAWWDARAQDAERASRRRR